MKKSFAALMLLSVVFSFVFVACEDDPPPPDPGTAYVLFAHSNFHDELNQYSLAVNGSLITPNFIGYKNTDVEYRRITAGPNSFAVIRGSDTVAKATFDIMVDRYFTIFTSGNGSSVKIDIHYVNHEPGEKAIIYFGNLASASPKTKLEAFFIPLAMGWVNTNDMFTRPEFGGGAIPDFKYREFVGYAVKDPTDPITMNRQIAVTPLRFVNASRTDTSIVVFGGLVGFDIRKAEKGKTVTFALVDRGSSNQFDLMIIENSELIK